MVLATQEELIASIRPGVTSVDSLYRDMQVLAMVFLFWYRMSPARAQILHKDIAK